MRFEIATKLLNGGGVVYEGILPCDFCTQDRADGDSLLPKPVWRQRALGALGLKPKCPGLREWRESEVLKEAYAGADNSTHLEVESVVSEVCLAQDKVIFDARGMNKQETIPY